MPSSNFSLTSDYNFISVARIIEKVGHIDKNSVFRKIWLQIFKKCHFSLILSIFGQFCCFFQLFLPTKYNFSTNFHISLYAHQAQMIMSHLRTIKAIVANYQLKYGQKPAILTHFFASGGLMTSQNSWDEIIFWIWKIFMSVYCSLYKTL